MIRELSISTPGDHPHGGSRILYTGATLHDAGAAMIMIHGRGATAEGILELSNYFDCRNVIFIAPQASDHIWYPYSFLSPEETNEPYLSSALRTITAVVDHLTKNGIPHEKIMLLGFSQGACLALEWTARFGERISAVFGLSGGLIGPTIDAGKYRGTLSGTTVFLGCSDIDVHIPKERVIESAALFEKLKAHVTMRLYANMGHTIHQDEIDNITHHLRTVAGTL